MPVQSKRVLDVIELFIPDIGNCVLFPIHSLPENKRNFAHVFASGMVMGLLLLEITSYDILTTVVIETCKKIPEDFTLLTSQDHCSIPTGKGPRLRRCIRKIRTKNTAGFLGIFSEEITTMTLLPPGDKSAWCIFRKQELPPCLLERK